MDKLDKFYYPILPQTLHEFFKKIFLPIQKGQSVSVVFPPAFGGARAWFKFFLDNLNLFKKTIGRLSNYKIVWADPAELIEDTPSGYLALLLSELTNLPIDPTKISFLSLFIQLKKHVQDIIKEKEIIFFLPKINLLSFFPGSLSRNLKSLWQGNKQKVHFVFIFTGKPIWEDYGELTKAMLENIVEVEPLSKEDSFYQIQRWEYLLKTNFSQKEKKAIFQLAAGYPYLIKACCQALAAHPKKQQNITQIIHFLKEQPLVKWISQQLFEPTKTVSLDPQTKELKIGDTPAMAYLTPKEYDLLRLFLKNKNKVVNRDQIAQVLWGANHWERYSDWAIDKMVSSLRKKLQSLNVNFSLKTLKKQGYIYLPQATGS